MLFEKNSVAVVSLLLLAQLAACSSDDNSTLLSSITWSECEDTPSLECSRLKVPMDYSQPEGVKIDIALIRKPATGADYKGSLLFNPGGPGGSGVDLIKVFAEDEFGSIPSSVLSAYDLVGFDPRGVGGSTAVECSEDGMVDINQYPIDESSIIQVHAQIATAAANCSAKYGDYLLHLGSLNVVRDMDKIRGELGDDRLNFIGYSYGTRLAALYLQEFPEKSGRIVLDGSMPPDSSLRSLVEDQIPQLQTNLLSVLSQCRVTDPNCDESVLLNNLVQRANVLAVATTEAELNEAELLFEFIIQSAQDPELGLFAAPTLVEYAKTLDVSVLELFVQQLIAIGFIDEDENGEEDNETIGVAVLCADDATRLEASDLIDASGEFNQLSDLFAEGQLTQLGMCSGWPASIEPLAPIVTNTAPVSLVIGGSTDAQTPIEWSSLMASQIGGVFISSDHPGHVVAFTEKSDCVDDIVEAFLMDGLAPVVQECR